MMCARSVRRSISALHSRGEPKVSLCLLFGSAGASHLLLQAGDLILSQGDLPRLALHQLPPLQATFLQPVEHRLRGDADRCGRSLDRVATIRPAWRVGVSAVDLDCPNAPLL